MMIIDPPSPFDPVDEWKAYLVNLRTLEQTDQVKEAIAEAEAWIKDAPAAAPEDDDFSDLED